MMNILDMKPRPHGKLKVTYAPEIMIEAPTRIIAQRAVTLIAAAMTLIQADFLLGDITLATPEQEDVLEDLRQHDVDHRFRGCTSGYGRATAIAAKATHRQAWKMALVKYWLSLRTCSVPAMELHPRYGSQFGIEKDPINFAMMAQAISTAYSCIEDLGFEIRASQANPTKINGAWNPVVLGELEKRLKAAHVNLNEDFDWALRSAPRRIERKNRPPKGKPLSWTKGAIRDRDIPLVDAINYASFLRSKVSAHATNPLTESLTMVEVACSTWLGGSYLKRWDRGISFSA